MSAREILVALFCLAMLIFVLAPGSVNGLRQAINVFVDRRRGGPPTPMHPSPANDGALLRPRRRKIEDEPSRDAA